MFLTFKNNFCKEQTAKRNTNAFASAFYFFANTQGNAEKNKKNWQANAPDSAGFVRTSMSAHKLLWLVYFEPFSNLNKVETKKRDRNNFHPSLVKRFLTSPHICASWR